MARLRICPRCEGCGWVAGIRGWERPLIRLARTLEQQAALPCVLTPRPCGDCAGAGADVPLDTRPARLPRDFLYGRGGHRN